MGEAKEKMNAFEQQYAAAKDAKETAAKVEAEVAEKLRAPFPADAIEWRVQQAGFKDGEPWARVLAYIDNRSIQDRLDEVFGVMGWWNDYKAGPDGGVVCGISILWDTPTGPMAITKWDGAENTDIESVKGGLSDSMKRAAVQYGIGRYLYRLEAEFADCRTTRAKGYKFAKAQGKTFFWKPPALPAWALPEGE
jgi:hypothetical protein